MTEQEWAKGADPRPMFEYLRVARGAARRAAGRRKMRLFACACLRGIWHLLRQPPSRTAVMVAEAFADGDAGEQGLRRAYEAAGEALVGESREFGKSPYWQSAEAATHVATRRFDGGDHPSVIHASFGAANAWAIEQGQGPPSPERQRRRAQALKERHKLHADWLRDIFGNPFRPVRLDPAWLAWKGGTIRQAAQAVYQERAFERLPLLADMLEDAGCSDVDILDHCRGPGPHVRGCWVVDLLLGKE